MKIPRKSSLTTLAIADLGDGIDAVLDGEPPRLPRLNAITRRAFVSAPKTDDYNAFADDLAQVGCDMYKAILSVGREEKDESEQEPQARPGPAKPPTLPPSAARRDESR